MTPSESINLSSPALLQKIDELREHNIGQHVPLPQLVVVGDQSSGKSSLLENLTGIPFPRNVELCTRHATQITSRRDRQNRVEVRIIPGPNASDEQKAYLEAYTHAISNSKDLRSRFPEILAEVNTRMGIRADIKSNTGSVFSEDVLKIEICGPSEDYLTVIDVPGIFRNHTEGITTKEDINLVNNLVRRYIRDQRTIILAVLPSNVDIATQEVLALAEQYDKQGERTLGVLTKPDLVSESNAMSSVCGLVHGKRMPLSVGYYIVRNCGADDDDMVRRDVLEQVFQQAPWCDLPPERVGILALKKQLEILLTDITRREVPNLRKEINEKLMECQKGLDSLGPARPGEKEQRSYLSAIARRFEDLTRRALSAQYSHHRFFDNPKRRLVTQLVNLTSVFGDTFREYGQSRRFEDIDGFEFDQPQGKKPPAETTEAEFEILTPKSLEFQKHLRAKALGDHSTVTAEDYPELSSILMADIEIEEPQRHIMRWIKELHFESRGLNLSNVSPELLSVAFVEQSRQWKQMTVAYMGEVVRLIHQFIGDALTHTCADEYIARELWSAIIDPVLRGYNSGLEHAVLLVDTERHQSPFTVNDSFNREIQVARGKRMKELLKQKAWRNAKLYSLDQQVIRLDDVLTVATTKKNEQHLEEEIHDALKSYYHLAVDRFLDNILRQAVGHHLLSGPRGPLSVFSQEWVIDLDAAKLEQIAGEKEAAKKRRQILTKKRKDLKKALDILNK